MNRESMEFDVIIVGAGPAGLSAAIQLAKLNSELTISVLEKGSEVGSHILSGAVLEPHTLFELIPDWKEKKAPLTTLATEDYFLYLTEKKSYRLPTPPQMRNHGNYILSLGQLCRWLAEQAEALGVNIFPNFPAAEILYENQKVVGVRTGDKGVNKAGHPTNRYQPGMNLYAKQTILAEGCRGSLTQMLMQQFNLREKCDPQTYALGLKELWEIPESQHQLGKVVHTIGWPLNQHTYGGSFVYHMENKQLAIGFVVGLDYQNPYLNPYEEFQRFKTHPEIKPLLENSKRMAFGARTLNEGGFQSIPKLTFPGGLLIGCAAGFLNVAKIKGIHNAMKSGIIAAESIHTLLQNPADKECTLYTENIIKSSIWKELYQVRNIRPAMNAGLWKGLLYAALDTYIFRGYAPWTLRNHADHLQLQNSTAVAQISYPKHDQQITFDLMNSVFLTHSIHDENQPCHLKLINPDIPIDINLKYYSGPEQRYCPAGVYEFRQHETGKYFLQINPANCIHCKACDIKDPTQNIIWTTPEGGSGPQYQMM